MPAVPVKNAKRAGWGGVEPAAGAVWFLMVFSIRVLRFSEEWRDAGMAGKDWRDDRMKGER